LEDRLDLVADEVRVVRGGEPAKEEGRGRQNTQFGRMNYLCTTELTSFVVDSIRKSSGTVA
jgi:hypothetical protein